MSRRFKSYLNNFEMKEKGKATFQSYVDFNDDDDDDDGNEDVEKTASAFFSNLLEPRKLQGEKMFAGADSVLMFEPFSDRKRGLSGHLFVTNFKISFVSADKSSYPDGDNNKTSQRNKLLENTDIPLTCVDSIYQVSSGSRRRKLSPGNAVSSTTEYLEIYCKDFQIHVFGFKFTPKDQNKQLTNAVVRFSSPGNQYLLFAYEFGHNSHFEDHQPPQFMDKEDWERELERLQCQAMWRVADANSDYQMSTSLPQYFVTPINLLNNELVKAAAQYTDKRIPTWSYTYVNGASLIRMSQILPESDFKTVEDKMLNAIKQSSGNEKDLNILDLGRMWCPSLLDVRTSHEKLKNIVMTDSAKDFYSSDSKWFSNLENSQWLQHVCSCLNTANHVVNQIMRESQTVVLKEESGCDMTCLVSCLVQMQLDPEYRTLAGFQSLVQREWVVMGHPFQQRLGLISPQESSDAEEGPVFLLFLDCVWQLLQQFPSSFEFTETYLTSLWDTVHIGLFDTFLFNNCWHRQTFLKGGPKMTVISLPSAWDWKFQLSDEQLLLFNNPLYKLRTSCDLDYVVDSAKHALSLSEEKLSENRYSMLLCNPPPTTDLFAMQESVLRPEVTVGLVKFWSQCFLRWIIPAQIVGGGNPSQYMQQCILAEEVVCLHHKVQTLSKQIQALDPSSQQKYGNHLNIHGRLKNSRPNSGLLFGSTGYQTTSSQLSSVYVTSSFPFSPGVSQQTQHTLIGKLSMYLKETEIDHDYAQDDDD